MQTSGGRGLATGAAWSWPAGRCPRAQAMALSPAACALCGAGPQRDSRRGPWRGQVSASVRGPGPRGGRCGPGRPHRAASAQLVPVLPVPRKHVGGSGGPPSDYFRGRGRAAPPRLDSACLPSALPVWIVHLATPDHHGGRTFCDIFPQLLCLVPFHENRAQMREPRAGEGPGAGEGLGLGRTPSSWSPSWEKFSHLTLAGATPPAPGCLVSPPCRAFGLGLSCRALPQHRPACPDVRTRSPKLSLAELGALGARRRPCPVASRGCHL